MIVAKADETVNDIEKFPYHGICGKCMNYKPKLDKDCLCEWCKIMGVKKISTNALPEQILRLVKPRF